MRKPAKQHVNFRMPVEMVQWIDEKAGIHGASRTEVLMTMLEYSQMRIDWDRVRADEFDDLRAQIMGEGSAVHSA